ncbi:MAG: hypothetical protein M1835_006767, partial [Candelina submexicana]
SFDNEVDLADHQKKHKEDYQRCPSCPEGFYKGRGLWKHFSNVHPTETFPDRLRGVLPKDSYPWGNRPGWKCSICSAVFNREAQLADHLKKHEEVEACPFCTKRYRTPRGLRVHIGKAHPEEAQRPKACSFCFKSYETWSGLNAHERRAHPEMHSGAEDPETNEGRTTVVECQIGFAEMLRGSLMQHMQLDHPDQCSSMDSVNELTSSPGQVLSGMETTTNLLPRTGNGLDQSGYVDKCAIDYVLNM